MHKPAPKWLKLLITLAALFGFMVFLFHFLFNSNWFQQWAIGTANRVIGIHVKSEALRFNALTGRFEGKNLVVKIPKAESTIEVSSFKLIFNPWSVLLRKVELFDAKASGIKINLGKISQAKTSPNPKTPVHIRKILDTIVLDKAHLGDITFVFPDGSRLYFGEMKLSATKPFLFYKKAYSINWKNIIAKTQKMDVFADSVSANGSFNLPLDEKTGKLSPKIDGDLQFKKLLLAVSKTPTPWNKSQGWDDSLIPLLSSKYGLPIPEDKTYAYFDKIHLPFYVGDDSIRLRQGLIKAFGGQAHLSASWEKETQKTKWVIFNSDSFKFKHLPFGKANIKNAFGQARLTFKGEGSFKKINENKLESVLSIEFLDNQFSPDAGDLNLGSHLNMKQGKIEIPDLNLKIGSKLLKASGHISLPEKNIQLALKSDPLDLKSILHLFSKIDMPGDISAEGNMRGALSNPEVDLNITSSGFAYESLFAGTFQGGLKIRDKKLSLSGVSNLGEGHGSLNLDIKEVFRSSLQVFDLKTEFVSMPANLVLKTPVFQGILDGHFSLHKEKGDYKGQGLATLSKVTWYGVPFEKISAKLDMGNNTFNLLNSQIVFENQEVFTNTKPFAFTFDKNGYTFNGPVFKNVDLQGTFLNIKPEMLHMEISATQADLSFVEAVFPFKVDTIMASAKATVDYALKSPLDSEAQIDLLALHIEGEEKSIHLNSKTSL
ncbi:MAG TPA: hypothetical protein DDW49_02660, partial [Deltaproteobacteria bacterium]|nr:hypothetical protein [Deltaproteobacteria bacterium]